MGYAVITKRKNHRSAVIWSVSYRDQDTKVPKRTQYYLGLLNEEETELTVGRDVTLTQEMIEGLAKKNIKISDAPPPPMGPVPEFLNRVTIDELSNEKIFSVGQYRILHTIASEEGFMAALNKACKDDAEALFALMCQRIDDQLSNYLFSDWSENTPFQSVNISKSPSAISNLLTRVDDYRIAFCKEWHSQLGSPTELIKDSTRLITYADPEKGRKMQEFGWSHHSEPGKRQINLSSLVDKKRGIPFFYDIYPGSINDISTERESSELKSFIHGAETDILEISDCGYMSKDNLRNRMAKKIHFIVESKFDTEFKRLWNENKAELLSDRTNRFEHHSKFYVSKSCKYCIDKKDKIYINGHMYLCHTEREMELDDLELKVKACADKFRQINFKSKDSAQKWLNEKTFNLGKYLILEEVKIDNKTKFDVKVNRKEILATNEHDGVYLYLSDLEYTGEEMFKLVHGKDPIEKLWRTIKTDLDFKTIKTKLDSTTSGQIFIAWGAGVLVQLLRERIKKYELNFTLNEIIANWGKIKIGTLRKLTYGKTLSKKAKDIIIGLRMESSFKEFSKDLEKLLEIRDNKNNSNMIEEEDALAESKTEEPAITEVKKQRGRPPKKAKEEQ